jgi:hypothetical protein
MTLAGGEKYPGQKLGETTDDIQTAGRVRLHALELPVRREVLLATTDFVAAVTACVAISTAALAASTAALAALSAAMAPARSPEAWFICVIESKAGDAPNAAGSGDSSPPNAPPSALEKPLPNPASVNSCMKTTQWLLLWGVLLSASAGPVKCCSGTQSRVHLRRTNASQVNVY